MKRRINNYLTIVALAALSFSAAAQSTIRVQSNDLRKQGNNVVIDATITVPADQVKSQTGLTLTPVLETDNQKSGLPSILLNGKTRQKVYNREIALGNLEDEPRYVVLHAPDAPEHVVEYQTTIPWEAWMQNARFVLTPDLCGCGKESTGDPIVIADRIMQRPNKPYEPKPLFAYIYPMAETRKERAEIGTAYLDFQVGRYAILPGFRNNASELAKIRQTIETVLNDQNITADGIALKGFASPEAPYNSNATLAKNRTEALRNYIIKQYPQFDRKFFTLDSEPEDWAGFKAQVEADRNVPSRTAVQAIINSTDAPDVKEQKLRALDGGTAFRYVLAELFPALRRTEYRINYSVRGFSVEEGREIIKTRPQHLSLQEMFAVANSYEAGSADYNAVFETAVRMFPSDPVANLNAANIAIHKGDYAAARRYLANAGDTPQATHTRGLLHLMENNLDEAEQLLRKAQTQGVTEAASNLEELEKKRADNALFAKFE